MFIEVVPYDPSWPQRFVSVRERLEEAMAAVEIISIEHVGSTAVPGLAAKPVIDVDVVVAAEHVQAAVAALEASGYVYEGEKGVVDRHALAAPDSEPRRNVYVIVDGCLALRNHLGVRDVLRTDAGLRETYGRLKTALARREFASSDEYVDAKSDLLQVILEQAGIPPEERAVIADANKPRDSRRQ